jgi:lysophospholipase L1-like esterase
MLSGSSPGSLSGTVIIMNAMLAGATIGSFALKAGDRVVFYGDSITEQQLYTVYVETFVRTRYPGLNVRFFNRGVGGDASWGGYMGAPDERVKRDVVPCRPTVVSIMLGMNDGCYYPYDQKTFNTVKEWYGKLLGLIRGAVPLARLTLIQTSPWDDVAHEHEAWDPKTWHPWKGYNDVLLEYGKVVRDEAARDGATFVDFNKPVLDVLKAAEAADRQVAAELIPDSIHPGPGGHLVMAGEMLKAWGASPLVSRVRLDAASGKVVEAENAKVSSFAKLNWTQLDGSLPFALDPENAAVKLVLAHCDFTAALNRETLQVDGLAAGTYELDIDGQAVAKLTAEQLASGVDLAALDTPMRRQALEVLDLVAYRNDIAQRGWRIVDVKAPADPGGPKTRRGFEALNEDLEGLIARTAKPVWHRFRIGRI